MKKILKTLGLLTFVALFMFSCDIEASRPLTKKVTIVVTDIPLGVGAMALYCNLNEWKASNVNGTDFVQPVVFKSGETTGKATFILNGYTLATPLKFQFTPCPSKDTKMGDNWWSFALSGSATYANQENNMYCDFIAHGITENCTITVSKNTFTKSGGKWSPFPLYGVSSARQFNEGYKECYEIK